MKFRLTERFDDIPFDAPQVSFSSFQSRNNVENGLFDVTKHSESALMKMLSSANMDNTSTGGNINAGQLIIKSTLPGLDSTLLMSSRRATLHSDWLYIEVISDKGNFEFAVGFYGEDSIRKLSRSYPAYKTVKQIRHTGNIIEFVCTDNTYAFDFNGHTKEVDSNPTINFGIRTNAVAKLM